MPDLPSNRALCGLLSSRLTSFMGVKQVSVPWFTEFFFISYPSLTTWLYSFDGGFIGKESSTISRSDVWSSLSEISPWAGQEKRRWSRSLHVRLLSAEGRLPF